MKSVHFLLLVFPGVFVSSSIAWIWRSPQPPNWRPTPRKRLAPFPSWATFGWWERRRLKLYKSLGLLLNPLRVRSRKLLLLCWPPLVDARLRSVSDSARSEYWTPKMSKKITWNHIRRDQLQSCWKTTVWKFQVFSYYSDFTWNQFWGFLKCKDCLFSNF